MQLAGKVAATAMGERASSTGGAKGAYAVSLLERDSLEQSLLWSRPSKMVAQGEEQEFASVAIAAVMRVPLFAHICFGSWQHVQGQKDQQPLASSLALASTMLPALTLTLTSLLTSDQRSVASPTPQSSIATALQIVVKHCVFRQQSPSAIPRVPVRVRNGMPSCLRDARLGVPSNRLRWKSRALWLAPWFEK